MSRDTGFVTLRSQTDEAEFAVPLEIVRRLEVSRGSGPATARGALIGGGIGTAAGLAIGVVAMGQNESGGGLSAVGNVTARDVALFTAVSAAVGTGIGAAIGYVSKRDRWKRDRWKRVSVAPAP